MNKIVEKKAAKNGEPWSISQIFLAGCLGLSLAVGLFIAATKLANYIEEKSDQARAGSISGCSNIDKENQHARSIFCPQTETPRSQAKSQTTPNPRQGSTPTTSISGSSVSPSTPSRKVQPSFYGDGKN